MSDTDRYSSFDYSRLVSWDDRLRREWSFLGALLEAAPARSVIDLGAGTGEHARFLAGHGFDVLGVDTSPAMLQKAREAVPEEEEGRRLRFVEGDMREVASLVDAPRGAALCLGNALPHLTDDDAVRRLATGLHRALLPGAPFVLQMLNYERFEAKGERALPLTFLPDPDDPEASIVFLRTMERREHDRVIFMPTILRQRPDREPPLELVASQRVEIRTWRRDQLVAAFSSAGFASVETFGSYQRVPFDPAESRDVILVARR